MFGALGASLVDTDAIAHALTAPHGAAMPAILAEFGAGFATPEGALDRAQMRSMADVLRHQDLNSASVYAHVDLPNLRPLAQPWPTEVRR